MSRMQDFLFPVMSSLPPLDHYLVSALHYFKIKHEHLIDCAYWVAIHIDGTADQDEIEDMVYSFLDEHYLQNVLVDQDNYGRYQVLVDRVLATTQIVIQQFIAIKRSHPNVSFQSVENIHPTMARIRAVMA